MVFIRTKKIKNKEYAYLVENTYRKRGNPVRQKTKQYLGKVKVPKKVSSTHFIEWLNPQNPKVYMDKSSEVKIVSDLVRWELDKHGEIQEQKVVLKINHGFLCGYTLHNIQKSMKKIKQESFQNKEAYERDYAIELAESFVKAGIEIPESVFIALFKKLIGAEKEEHE